MTEEKFKIEKKLEMEEEIETEDLKGFEQLMSTQFNFFSKKNLDVFYGQAKTDNQLYWSQLRKTSLSYTLLKLL